MASDDVKRALALARGSRPAAPGDWRDRDRLVLAAEVVRLQSYGEQFAKVEAELRAEIARLRGVDE